MPRRQTTPPPAEPDVFERLGGGLIRLLGSLLLGTGVGLAGLFVLVWADQRIDIADMVRDVPHLNDRAVKDGTAATVTGRLEVVRPVADPLLPRSGFAFVLRRVQICTAVEASGTSAHGATADTSDSQATELVPAWVDFRPELLDPRREGDIRPLRSVGGGLSVAGRELQSVPEVLGGHVIAPAPGSVAGARTIDEQWVYMDAEDVCETQDSMGARRVSFEVLRTGDLVTAFGTAWRDELRPWRGQLLLGLGGRDGLSERIGNRREKRAWWVRAVGATILWIGLMVLLEPALTLLGVVPMLGGLMRGAATLLTMLTALALTLGFVFLGWGRPLLDELFWGILR